MWLPVIFLGLPLIEIALFVQIGGWIGLWPTLAWVLLSAVLGIAVMRAEGVRVMADMRAAMQTRMDPALLLADGAMVMLAGVLLVLPGFFTDTLGLLLLLPPLRHGVTRALGRRIRVAGRAPQPQRPYGQDTTIDGDYVDLGVHQLPTSAASSDPDRPAGN